MEEFFEQNFKTDKQQFLDDESPLVYEYQTCYSAGELGHFIYRKKDGSYVVEAMILRGCGGGTGTVTKCYKNLREIFLTFVNYHSAPDEIEQHLIDLKKKADPAWIENQESIWKLYEEADTLV
jgi:hypothetical protein